MPAKSIGIDAAHGLSSLGITDCIVMLHRFVSHIIRIIYT